MSPTTRRIREMSFRVVECEIPGDMTLDEYRRERAAAGQPRGSRRRFRRLRRPAQA